MFVLMWALGCGAPADEASVAPTYHQDVAPVLAEHCGACHDGSGIGPFTVLDYQTAKEWAEPMLDSVETGRMPPFFADDHTDECDMRVAIKNDPRLDESEKEVLRAWVAAGAPEGEPAAPPTAPVRDVLVPDAIVQMPAPYTVTGGRDIYRCFRIPLPMDGDAWLTGVEVLPGNDKVVHHVVVWSDPEDQSSRYDSAGGGYSCGGDPGLFPTEIVAVWAPGGFPTRAPDNAGTLVHGGGSLVLNIHYHPTGTTDEVDQTSLALTWRTDQPELHTTWFLVDLPFGAQVLPGPRDHAGAEFRIPANDAKHRETVSFTMPPYLGGDVPIFAIMPHMHYLGSEMLVTIKREVGDECLIHSENFRFDFQESYTYDVADQALLPTLRIGERMEVRCTYNNSPSNPFMPAHLDAAGVDAPRDVYWGEETGDEMCMAVVGLLLPPVDWLEMFGNLF